MLAALAPGIEIDLLVSSRRRGLVDGWRAALPARRMRITGAPDVLDFTLWAQDAVAVRGDGSLLRDRGFARQDDAQAAAMLARAARRRVTPIDGALEGGNLLAVGPWLLMGSDLAEAAGRPAAELAALIDGSRLPVELGVAEVLPGEATCPAERPAPGWTETHRWRRRDGTRQPLFHIDLFVAPAGLTPGGLPRLVVGCPRAGARLLGHPLLPEAEAEQFDRVADDLARAGAEVHRAPMPLIWIDNPETRHRTWLHLPVCNLLVETGLPGNRVHLPGFAAPHWPELARLDAALAALWQDLGFEVIPVPEMTALAERLGGLRCMVSVLERDPPAG